MRRKKRDTKRRERQKKKAKERIFFIHLLFIHREKRDFTKHTDSFEEEEEKHTIIMGEEADTETFAFQAEINQLLSLIINVRLRCFFGIIIVVAFFFVRSICVR